jgi:ParB family chromosome partitioning protein
MKHVYRSPHPAARKPASSLKELITMECFPTTFVRLKHLRFGHEHPMGAVNIRRPSRADGERLAPSIRQEGLLQALCVCAEPGDGGTGPYFTIVGGRRLMALHVMREAGDIDGELPVSVVIAPDFDAASALAKSLAAEDAHVPPHPVDRFEAFHALSVKGMGCEDIAARFFIEARIVRQALALGALAPEIRAAWRAGEIGSEIAQNFTLADGHKDQVKTLEKLRKKPGGLEKLDVATVRKQFTGSEAEANRLLKFVTRDAYVAAGGALTEDLFTSSIVVHDFAKLKRMAQEKLDLEANRLTKGEGWSWAEPQLKTNHMHYGFAHLKAEPKLTADEKKRIKEIDVRITQIENASTDDAHDCTAEEAAELDRLEAEKEGIEGTATARAFKPEQKAKGGCIIRIGEGGALIVEAGLVKPKEGTSQFANHHSAKQAPRAEPALDHVAIRALKDWRSVAAGEAVQRDERLALAALLAGLDNWNGPINVDWQMGSSHEKMTAAKTFPGALAILRKLPLDKLVSLVVKAIAASIDVNDDDSGEFVEALDQKVYTDALRKQFDAKVYFKGASKPHILSVIEEALGVDEKRRNNDKSQTDLAKFAVDSVAPIGWLPEELRTEAYVAPKPKAAAAPKVTASEAKAALGSKTSSAKSKVKVAAAAKKGAGKRKSK